MSSPPSSETTPSPPLLETIAANARESGVFAQVRAEGPRLVCTARDVEAEYRVDLDLAGPSRCRVWVSMVTPDRWLSESIESELLNTGDPIEELLEDELADLGWEGTAVAVEHFRSEEKLFTFRSGLCFEEEPSAAAAAAVTTCLLAYQACFVQLGDMAGED